MRKIFCGLLSLFVGFAVATVPLMELTVEPTYAAADLEECKCDNGKTGTRPKTAIIGNGTDTGCECGSGEGVMSILSLVVNAMTVGIGILGVLGITIVGVQYLTAGSNEEQTRKAKRRMVEIVIGLVAYILLYAILNWLVPGFKPLGG